MAYCASRIVSAGRRRPAGLCRAGARPDRRLHRHLDDLVLVMDRSAGGGARDRRGIGVESCPALPATWSPSRSLFMVVLTIVNLRGIKAAGELNFVTVLIKVLPLIAVVAIAAMLGATAARFSRSTCRLLFREHRYGVRAVPVRADRFRIRHLARRQDPRSRAQPVARARHRRRRRLRHGYLLTTLALSLIIPNSSDRQIDRALSRRDRPLLGRGRGDDRRAGDGNQRVRHAERRPARLRRNAVFDGAARRHAALSSAEPTGSTRLMRRRSRAPHSAASCSHSTPPRARRSSSPSSLCLPPTPCSTLFARRRIAAAIKDRRPLTTFAAVVGLAFVALRFLWLRPRGLPALARPARAGRRDLPVRKPLTSPPAGGAEAAPPGSSA